MSKSVEKRRKTPHPINEATLPSHQRNDLMKNGYFKKKNNLSVMYYFSEMNLVLVGASVVVVGVVVGVVVVVIVVEVVHGA